MIERKKDWEKEIASQLSEERWLHTLGTIEIALHLAKIHRLNEEKVYLATLLHDIGKAYPLEKQKELALAYNLLSPEDLRAEGVVHAKVSAYLARERYRIQDEDILFVIAHHSTGHPDYGPLGWVVYVSDYLDPNRKLVHQTTLLATCEADLKEGCLQVLLAKLQYLFDKRKYLHSYSVDFYHSLIQSFPF
ncbi:MAG: bis(5'-nucleosyl)-tetraphosphatase (symmetrical) YqeK [Brevinematales bacterium]|nr:bis(5'-nucleosyl)-tetraphosphatase (symmetrical) YqeK [Brevinematales bacterium]